MDYKGKDTHNLKGKYEFRLRCVVDDSVLKDEVSIEAKAVTMLYKLFDKLGIQGDIWYNNSKIQEDYIENSH